MATIPVPSRKMILKSLYLSAGLNALTVVKPMLCFLPRLCLIPRYPYRSRLLSYLLMRIPEILNRSWARTPSIDENLIASITKRYIMHWMQKIRSFRVDLSFPSRLVKLCFSLFMNQFMQIRQTPNILFLTPT